MTVSVIITTKNRKIELQRAIRSVLSQTIPAEIVVFDDGSDDGTGLMIHREFPLIRYERAEHSLGIVNARNRALRLGVGSILITIDDDCVLSSPRTIEQTVREFCLPVIGAVAIPCVDSGRGLCNARPLDLSQEIYAVSEFMGGASAIRRDVFVGLGGYNPCLWRQAEEYDFCTRMFDAGYLTRLGEADPIYHYPSTYRTSGTVWKHIVRSHILYAWFNVPGRMLPAHMTVTLLKTMSRAAQAGEWRAGLRGAASGAVAVAKNLDSRRAVSLGAYRLMRRLRRSGPRPLGEVEPLLRTLVPNFALLPKSLDLDGDLEDSARF